MLYLRPVCHTRANRFDNGNIGDEVDFWRPDRTAVEKKSRVKPANDIDYHVVSSVTSSLRIVTRLVVAHATMAPTRILRIPAYKTAM